MSSDFPYEKIRSLLIEYLAKKKDGNFQEAVSGVVELAKEHNLYTGSSKSGSHRIGVNYDLGGQDAHNVPEEVRQLFWQLLIQGILVFGSDDLNPTWPWYRVTKYGEDVLSKQGAQPYDPDGFLKEFATVNPAADNIVVDYLEEAVHTFNTGCYKAAAVMLGCASEQLVLVFHETFENAIPDPTKKEAFRKSYGWTISSKFESLRAGLDVMITSKTLPKELCGVVHNDLVGCFELIRRCRNSAGHPELSSDIRREAVYLSLTVFREYARQVLKLVAHFGPNSENL